MVLSAFMAPLQVERHQIPDSLRASGFDVVYLNYNTWDYMVRGDVHFDPRGMEIFAERSAEQLASRVEEIQRAKQRRP